MTVWTLSDLHLAFGVPGKTMEAFGPAWKNYAHRIEGHWKKLVAPEDLVLIPGDISWAMHLEEAVIDLKWIAVSFLGGGAFLLISIAIRLVKAGTGLLAAMVMDIESLKKIISKTITANMNKSGLGQGSGTQAL